MDNDLIEFMHRENLRLYAKQLVHETSVARRKQLIRLLATEEAAEQSRAAEPKSLRQIVSRFSALATMILDTRPR